MKKLLCFLLGHDWCFSHYVEVKSIEEPPGYAAVKWIEKCRRCPAERSRRPSDTDIEADQQLAAARNKDGGRMMLIKTSGGAIMENPLLYTRKRAWDQVFKAAACFGLTPADLGSVRAVEKPAEDDGKAKFFRGA